MHVETLEHVKIKLNVCVYIYIWMAYCFYVCLSGSKHGQSSEVVCVCPCGKSVDYCGMLVVGWYCIP